MKTLAIFLSVVLCSVLNAQSAAIEEASVLSDNFGVALKGYYSALQRIMPCGFAAAHIPVLSPYTLKEWNINFKNHEHSIRGVLKNIEVTGLQNFQVLESTYDAETGIVNLDLFYPEIEFLAEYNAAERVKIFGAPLHMDGEGVLDIKIVDWRNTVQFTIAPNATNLQFLDYKVSSVLGDIKFNNWNNMWSDSVNNFVNQIAREITLFAVQEVQPYYNSFMNEHGFPYVNNLVKTVTLNDVVNSLNAFTTAFNTADCQA